jgi:hypothetical protein
MTAIERYEEVAREALRSIGNGSDWPRTETDWEWLDSKVRELRYALDKRSGSATIDHGDLLEICQAAEAWARSIRAGKGGDDVRYQEVADRIDRAIAAARNDAFGSAE